MFVSQEKQAQHQAARKLKLWSRVVAAAVIMGGALIAGFFLWFFMIPYFQQEIITNVQPVNPGESQEPVPDYDELGLPIYDDSVNLFVINSLNPNEEYVPKLSQIENIQVDSRITDALRQLVAAAKEDNLVLIFTDGYVSYEEQGERFEKTAQQKMNDENLTAVMAKTTARAQTPMAGESDFQTGLCLRIAGDKETFKQSRTYSWLKANMGKYGFVFRYPEGKNNYTYVDPDPTVLRYVGGSNASAMQERSMCLEEYISYIDDQ
jgi:D-alanyl-D-alanine carboxypeptidase